MIHRSTNPIRPILGKEFAWAVGKWEVVKWGKWRNPDPGQRMASPWRYKKARFVSLNTWLNGPTLMEEIGGAETKSEDFDEKRWK